MNVYLLQPEMLWKPHPDVLEARKHPDWGPFHRACGKAGLNFDLPSTAGRQGFTIVAFTTQRHRLGGYLSEKLGEGRGKTVFQALEAAYQAAGRPVPDAEPHLDRMLGRDVDDFADALGGGDDDFEGMLM